LQVALKVILWRDKVQAFCDVSFCMNGKTMKPKKPAKKTTTGREYLDDMQQKMESEMRALKSKSESHITAYFKGRNPPRPEWCFALN